ncbi:MAG: stage II sporulation protein D [Desulfocucumaceae bacterium]
MKKYLILFIAFTIFSVIGIPMAVNLFSPVKIEKSGTVVHLYSHVSGKIVNLPVEEYIVGVVAAEMPAEFPEEALKAQAVAARTYIMKRLTGGGVSNPLHPGADVCDDHRHYQAWISREEMKTRWGSLKYYRYYFKVAMAVYSTGDDVLMYGGQLIDPVYHSSCGGSGTVSAGEVWKFEVPYLKGVPCPYCADPKPSVVALFSQAEIKKATGEDITTTPVTTGQRGLFEIIDKTASGSPKTVRIGGKTFSAVEVREKLGLRSARFTITMEENKVKVTTQGYGHGVGMCQYGAKGMALKGSGYRDILKHYYTGTEILSPENFETVYSKLSFLPINFFQKAIALC